MAAKANVATQKKAATKREFVRYISKSHYSGANIALYKKGSKFVVVLENIDRRSNSADVRAAVKVGSNLRQKLSKLSFNSAEDAREWFEDIDGNTDVQKLFFLILDSLNQF